MNVPKTPQDALKIQLQYTGNFTKANLAGIDHQASLKSPVGGGNCLNWVLGHLVNARNGACQLLGQEPVFDPAAIDRYKRGSAPITTASDAQDFAALLEAFSTAQDRILAGLDAVSEEVWSAPAPFSPSDDPNETIGSLLAGLVFHESYHVGQLSAIRRGIGLEGAIK